MNENNMFVYQQFDFHRREIIFQMTDEAKLTTIVLKIMNCIMKVIIWFK